MMRKIHFLLISILIFVLPFTVYAGSIDVDLLADDEALVFIGSVDDYKITDEEEDYPDTEYSLTVTPNRKIKGDVIVGKSMDFEKVSTGKIRLQKDVNYLFGYMRNELYVWELESYNELFDWEIDNYTEESIILKERHNNSIAECMQELLNTGGFVRAEEERQNLGKQISFAEFLGEDLESSMKIVFSFKDEQFEVDKDKFIKLASEIQITNVKNETVYDTNYDKVLFIRGVNSDSTTKGRAYVAITPHGEVDRNSPAMSRMLVFDYKMEPDDIKKLYELFPYNLQDEILEEAVNNIHEDGNMINTTTLVISAGALIFLVVIVILFIRKRR